jgi:hypothetical protein
MDQHPIPQDVTGFQFKLIGSMTVKQFGYVASGVILAVILYYLPLAGPFAIMIKLIFVPIFGGSGVILAFVPIEGRPIDLMATNFVKALFSPNQYVYHRQGRKLSFSSVAITQAPVAQKTSGRTADETVQDRLADDKGEKLRALLLNSQGRVKNDLDKKEAAFLNSFTPITPTTVASPAKLTVHIPTPAPIPITPSPHKEPNEVLANKEKQLGQEVQQVHEQKQQLDKEIVTLQQQLSVQKAPAPMPAQTQLPIQPAAPIAPKPAAPPTQDPQHVRTIPQAISKKAGLPRVSDTPNVVVGIVKDPRGNVLSNILVEVKDKDGNPVRAFKTNALGQFASATPLSVGSYTLELEDPKKQHRFDIIQVTANNQIMPPIEVISHDAREDLRQQLFNQ